MWKSGALGRLCVKSQAIVFMIFITTPLNQLSSQGAIFEFRFACKKMDRIWWPQRAMLSSYCDLLSLSKINKSVRNWSRKRFRTGFRSAQAFRCAPVVFLEVDIERLTDADITGWGSTKRCHKGTCTIHDFLSAGCR